MKPGERFELSLHEDDGAAVAAAQPARPEDVVSDAELSPLAVGDDPLGSMVFPEERRRGSPVRPPAPEVLREGRRLKRQGKSQDADADDPEFFSTEAFRYRDRKERHE